MNQKTNTQVTKDSILHFPFSKKQDTVVLRQELHAIKVHYICRSPIQKVFLLHRQINFFCQLYQRLHH